jgi:hypothetical protein
MFASIPQDGLTAQGQLLDRHPAAFGWLESSTHLLDRPAALQARMQSDGYLYLPGLLAADTVQQVRAEICTQLAAEGLLEPGYPTIAAVAKPETRLHFRPDLVAASPTLRSLLYAGNMLDFYRRFLDSEVLHFDYTWFRAVAPGLGTPPHCDCVYMGRGTPNLYTSWTPIGDVSLEMGGLLILEHSHRLAAIRNGYAQRDVDSFCADRINSHLYASGQRHWSGVLTRNPVSLQRRYGGRWLTANFQAGDVVIFSIFTVHASLDNHSPQVRLSADSRYQRADDPADDRWIGTNPIGHSPAVRRSRIC